MKVRKLERRAAAKRRCERRTANDEGGVGVRPDGGGTRRGRFEGMKTNPSAFSRPLSFFAVTGLLVLVSLSPSAACAQAADVPVVVPAAVPGGVRVVAPAGSATVANAQVVSANGIVDVYEPGTRVVVKETTGPVTYTYGPQVVYATPGGMVLTAEQVKTRMRAGLPIRVEYVTQGNSRVVKRVVIEERYLRD